MIGSRLLVYAAFVALICCIDAEGESSIDPSCHKVAGPQFLRFRVKAPCVITREDDYTVIFSYAAGSKKKCSVSFFTREPNHLAITPLEISIGAKEKLWSKTILATTTYYESDYIGVTSYVPVSQTSISFTSDGVKDDSTFRMSITAKDSGCSFVCEKPESSFKMPLNFATYAANSYCHIWIMAKKNMQIQAEFSKFNIGSKLDDGSCEGDFMVLNPNGAPAFSKQDSEKYCGENTVVSLKSTTNKMYYILNGKAGGTTETEGSFTVYDPNAVAAEPPAPACLECLASN